MIRASFELLKIIIVSSFKFNLFFIPLMDQETMKICQKLSSQLTRMKFETASTTGFDVDVRSKNHRRKYKENIFFEILIYNSDLNRTYDCYWHLPGQVMRFI